MKDSNSMHASQVRTTLQTFAWLILCSMLAGCPSWFAPAPTVTFTFPNAVSCPAGSENIVSSATLMGVGTQNPVLRISVCITCNTTTLVAGAAVSCNRTSVDLLAGLPANKFSGATDATGCFTSDISVRNLPGAVDASALVGKKFRVTVQDTSTPPQTISSQDVTIQ